jgi:hypothetical protein
MAIHVGNRAYYCAAETREDLTGWIQALQSESYRARRELRDDQEKHAIDSFASSPKAIHSLQINDKGDRSALGTRQSSLRVVTDPHTHPHHADLRTPVASLSAAELEHPRSSPPVIHSAGNENHDENGFKIVLPSQEIGRSGYLDKQGKGVKVCFCAHTWRVSRRQRNGLPCSSTLFGDEN